MISILIIEDDDDYRELLEIGLTNAGYLVQVASRAKQGLALLTPNAFDLVICDVLMPEMDGLEFLIETKKTNVQAKIIMMSGGGIANNKLYLDNSIAMGSDAVIEKPFTITELVALIKTVV